MEKRIRIIAVDDFETHLNRLKHIIKNEPDFDLVCTAASEHEAIEKALEYAPDVILMDIGLDTPSGGIRAAQIISKALPDTKIVMLTLRMDDEAVFHAFQAGAVNYLIKSSSFLSDNLETEPAHIVNYIDKTESAANIIKAIRDAYSDMSLLDAIITKKLRNEIQRVKTKEQGYIQFAKLISVLTPSEMEVLKLLKSGMSKREIAQQRFVEHDTIKKQVTAILKKCGYSNMKDLLHNLEELGIEDFLDIL